MDGRSPSRTFAILLALAGLGAGLVALAGGHPAAVAAVLLLAFLKGRLVLLDFMEMRRRAGPMRSALVLWCGALLAAALARFLIAG